MGFGPLLRVDFLLVLLLTLRGLLAPHHYLKPKKILSSPLTNLRASLIKRNKKREMGFFLFLGRVFFASLIIVSAWQM